MKKQLKLAIFALTMLAAGAVNAQTTTGDVAVQANTTLGTNGGTVKLVDNKGTIKYLQANNGLTSFTNTTPSGGVVTTWQLGGTLTANTTIETGTQTFTIDGNTFTLLGTDAETGAAAVADAGDAVDGIANTGYTVLVRDEATGTIKKLLASDIFQVTAIRVTDDTLPTNAPAAGATSTEALTVAGLPIIDANNEGKLFLFRNGVKLRHGVDFTATVAGTIQIQTSDDLHIYAGDVFEVQYIN